MSENENELAAENNRESIRCRYCGQRNQTRDNGGAAKCGRCRLPLSDAPHKKFADLNKHDYVHPLDSRALAALRAIPGIDSALKKLLAVTGESAIRVIFTASAVKVTPYQCCRSPAPRSVLTCPNSSFSSRLSSTPSPAGWSARS